MKDKQLKQALSDKESAENDLKELRLSLDDAALTKQLDLENKSQEWEEEKAQMLVQIRAYKRECDARGSALAQEREKVASLQQQLDIMAGLKEKLNELTAERDDLGVKVMLQYLVPVGWNRLY